MMKIILVIFVSLLLFNCCYAASQSQLRGKLEGDPTIDRCTIVIYTGKGSSSHNAKLVYLSFKHGFDNKYNIVKLGDLELDSVDISNAIMFVVPSGSQTDLESVAEKLISLIYNYVKKGGNYLGFGSSAYIVSSKFNYNNKEFTSPAPLFNGIAKGPLVPVNKDNLDGVRVVEVMFEDKTLTSFYYHGGPFFTEIPTNCKVIGLINPTDNGDDLFVAFNKDDTTSNKAIIISCQVGKGNIILSGVQLENNKAFLELEMKKNPGNQKIIDVHSKMSSIEDHMSKLYLILGSIGINRPE